MIDRHHGGVKENTVDFSVNLNAFIDENTIKELLCRYYKKAIKYPEQRGHSLIQVISGKYGIPKENIVLGNGSIEIFYALPKVLQIEKVFTFEPTFSEYRYVAKVNNLKYYPVKYVEEFKWDLGKVLRKLDEKSMLFICNPNNPTGSLFTKKDILSFIKTGAYIAVDEAFMDFSQEDESLIQEAVKYKNLIVVKSLTKIYSIAGLRIGFCVCSKRIINELDKILPLWNVNGLALHISKEFMLNNGILQYTKHMLKQEKEFILKNLRNNKEMKLFDTYANFFLAYSEKTPKLIDFLSRNNITVREYKGFYGLDDRYFRFAIKSRRENELLINSIKDFFKGEY